MTSVAGWYADPWRQAPVRWFDGREWTAATSTASGWYFDPWQLATWRWFDGAQWTPIVHAPRPHGLSSPGTDPHTGTAVGRDDDPDETSTDPHGVLRTAVAELETDRDTVGHAQSNTAPEAVAIIRTEEDCLSPLGGLLGSARGLAVIDVETTGLGRNDRVVEIAIITLDPSGAVVDEFETLVNPHRDVGPTWIHGLTASMLAGAPAFADIADAVAARIDGMVVVAHNISFDTRMLDHEFRRTGLHINWGEGLDTLAVTRCKLGAACTEYGISLDDGHRASADARATAQLLLMVVDRFASPAAPALTGAVMPAATRVMPRGVDARVVIAPPLLVDLARELRPSADVASYSILLDQALADLRLTTEERNDLRDLARDNGLSAQDIDRAHREFLTELVEEALDDGIVTDEEIDKLVRVAALLDLDSHTVTTRTDPYRLAMDSVALAAGMLVCFTGDAVSHSRDELHTMAIGHGLVPVETVTAKRCQLLVASDTATLSGKAKAAHKFGIPIASTDDFLATVESSQHLPVTIFRRHGVACVCEACGSSWTASRRARFCSPCRRPRAQRAPVVAEPTVVPTAVSEMDILTCRECSQLWQRPRSRGRRPHSCPDCVASTTV